MPTDQFPAPLCASLLRVYKRKIARTARRLGVDPEDVEHDLTLVALRAWPKYQEAASAPRTFLDRVVRNALTSLDRTWTFRKRSRTALLSDGEALLPAVTSVDQRPAGADARMFTEEVLAVLDEEDRHLCRFLAEGSVAQAAARCGFSRQQVYRRCTAIKERFDSERGQLPRVSRM